MKFSAVFASIVAVSAAAPPWCPTHCLTQDDANTLVTRFIGILSRTHTDLGNANQTAQALLSPGFTESSDSILALQKRPLGGQTSTSKQAYISAILATPPDRNITTLDIVAGCKQVVWHWRFPSIASARYPVQGFNLFDVDLKCRGKERVHQIKRLQLEFNSLAWGLDDGELGCNTTAKKSR